MAVLKKENQTAVWLKARLPWCYWNLWNMTILSTLFQNCFPLVPLSLKRKFITLWSKFKHLRSRTGHSPLQICSSLIELQTGWEAMCLETREGVSLHILSSFIHLPIIWMEFIICCKGVAYYKSASGRAGAAGSLGMNGRPQSDLIRGGKHMFCWSW